jgi:methionine-rich copper-binding protein CopC
MNAVKKLATVFALLMLSLSPVSPASAHTEIDHTTPAANSSVEAGVQNVSVVFTDKILNLADSTEIVISDAEGQSIEVACIEVKNTSISADAFFPAGGEYTVTWRTVAEDGHPIDGSFSFTVTGTAEKTDFSSCLDQASQGNVVIATPKAEPLMGVEKTATQDTGIAWPFWVAGVLVIGLGAVVIARRKNSKG